MASDGTVSGLTHYDPYGSPRPGSTAGRGIGYAGEYRDPSGLINLRARAYDPVIGRFVGRDTFAGIASAPQSGNRYAYALANPLRYTDPSGHFVNFAWQNRAEIVSVAISLIPGVGTVYMATCAVTGRDLITGRSLSTIERVAFALPLLGKLASGFGHALGEAELVTGSAARDLGVADRAAAKGGAFERAAAESGGLERGAAEAAAAERGAAEAGVAGRAADEAATIWTHPVTGIEMREGFPVFESLHDFRMGSDLIGATDFRQMSAATRDLRATLEQNPSRWRQFTEAQQAAIRRGRDRIPDYTWHHNEDGVTLQLVDRTMHQQTGHLGGRAITGTTR